MSDTPRTDKEEWDADLGNMVVFSSFARRLERELAEARRALESLTPGGSEYHNDTARCASHIRHRLDSMNSRIVTLIKERNQLAAKGGQGGAG